MRTRKCYQPRIGCSTAFWVSGGFEDAEEALAKIKERREEKEILIKSLASLAYSFEGSLNYETLKQYPQREIDILAEVLDSINKQRSVAVEKASRGAPGGFNPNETIGIS